MRPARLGDATAAARVLLARPEGRWPWVMARMLAEARAADGRVRARGRPHPRWGDGSLMAAALRRRPGPEPALDDARFRRALVAVLAGLEALDQPRMQDRQRGTAGSRASRSSAISSPQSVQKP